MLGGGLGGVVGLDLLRLASGIGTGQGNSDWLSGFFSKAKAIGVEKPAACVVPKR